MGLGLNTDTPVPARSEVLIEMDGCIVSGEVCYCREIGHDYRIGIQLDQMLAVPDDPTEPVRHIYKAGNN
jgi:hypothetical protein